jgi:hypothetical protein
MCVYTKNGLSWVSKPLIDATSTDGFDTSPSTKWSGVNFNRPETFEAVITATINDSYTNTNLYYVRF